MDIKLGNDRLLLKTAKLRRLRASVHTLIWKIIIFLGAVAWYSNITRNTNREWFLYTVALVNDVQEN